MTKTVTMTMRMEPEVKAAVEEIYSYYGMTLTEAVNVFFHQSINVRGLPFDLRPNKETLGAIEEVEDMMKHPGRYKGYRDVDELFTDALNEQD